MEVSGADGERGTGVGTAGTPLPSDPAFAGASLGVVGAIVRALLEERVLLQRRIAEIERSNTDLEAFAGRAAHEVRNALAPVRLGCRILRGVPVAEIRPVADAMDRSLRTAVTLVDALLVFSRVGSAARAGEAGDAAVVATLTAVVEDLRPAIRAGGVDLCLDAGDPGLRVGCDQGLLHIVLANVIGNAVKFVARGDLRRVSVAAVEDGARALLTVEDTGPGIPPEAMDRLFEPFFRVPATGIEGHGLGLATVRRILVSCGGRVRIESEPGRGTRVSIELPVRR